MKISLNELKNYFDVSKLLDNENLPTNISIGAQIIFESSFDDNLVLNDDNLFYILEAAHHFKLHSIESDCKSLFRTRMDGENSTETLIICQKYFNIFKGTLNLGISNVSKIFHELSYEQLYHIETKYVYFILNQNYKFDCNELTILDVVLKWMIIYGEFLTSINVYVHFNLVIIYCRKERRKSHKIQMYCN